MRCLRTRERHPTGSCSAAPPARLLPERAALTCFVPTLHSCALRNDQIHSAQRRVCVGTEIRSFLWISTVPLTGEGCARPCCVATIARATIMPVTHVSPCLPLRFCDFPAGNLKTLRVVGGRAVRATTALEGRSHAGMLARLIVCCLQRLNM